MLFNDRAYSSLSPEQLDELHDRTVDHTPDSWLAAFPAYCFRVDEAIRARYRADRDREQEIHSDLHQPTGNVTRIPDRAHLAPARHTTQEPIPVPAHLEYLSLPEAQSIADRAAQRHAA